MNESTKTIAGIATLATMLGGEALGGKTFSHEGHPKAKRPEGADDADRVAAAAKRERKRAKLKEQDRRTEVGKAFEALRLNKANDSA